ncbi:MAG: hypothetical protein AABX11_02785 [Nanoarchaeota archaeon]
MKLQKQVSRVYKGEEYEKFWIVIPSKLVKLLEWKTGQDLEGDVKDGKLIVEKKKK